MPDALTALAAGVVHAVASDRCSDRQSGTSVHGLATGPSTTTRAPVALIRRTVPASPDSHLGPYTRKWYSAL